jgi:hypothetical protein
MNKKKFLTLKEIEGVVSTHDVYLKHEIARRVEAFEYIEDVQEVAEYIGAEVCNLNIKCDWVIKKEFFPEVEAYFLYNRKDEEFPASLNVIFSGERVKDVKGDDLATLVISTINHILRYIKNKNPDKNLPEICSIV